MLLLREIFVSPGHSYFGRHGRPPAEHAIQSVERVECVAGQGLRGDRFFAYKPDYRGQVTLFAAEVWREAAGHFCRPDLPAWAFRRNLLVEGCADLTVLVGQTFRLQEVELEGVEECRPCYWMETAVGPGAEAWLKGRGGLRCRVRQGGWLARETAARPPVPAVAGR